MLPALPTIVELWVEVIGSEKDSSLLQFGINDAKKK
jgi:hypothetical protein